MFFHCIIPFCRDNITILWQKNGEIRIFYKNSNGILQGMAHGERYVRQGKYLR